MYPRALYHPHSVWPSEDDLAEAVETGLVEKRIVKTYPEDVNWQKIGFRPAEIRREEGGRKGRA